MTILRVRVGKLRNRWVQSAEQYSANRLGFGQGTADVMYRAKGKSACDGQADKRAFSDANGTFVVWRWFAVPVSRCSGLNRAVPHRAKGLEFDDVIILDGGWERPSRNEDQDAPRRLFYVAMTRARRNLIVMSNDNHEYLPAQSSAIINRHVTPDLTAFPWPRRYFQSAEARIVDLSFAGRQRAHSPVLHAIAEARVGDPIFLTHEQDRWQLKDAQGRSLGRMAKSFTPPLNTRFLRGEIAAILRWRKEDGDEAYYHILKRDAWDVVIPELVFEAV